MKVPRSFLPEFDFYKNHVRMEMNMKMFDISTNRKLCQLKETTTKKISRRFNLEKSWSHIGGWDRWYVDLCVVDPGERPMTKDNHLLGKLLEEQWISLDENPSTDGVMVGMGWVENCNGFWRWRKVIDIIVISTMLKKERQKIVGLCWEKDLKQPKHIYHMSIKYGSTTFSNSYPFWSWWFRSQGLSWVESLQLHVVSHKLRCENWEVVSRVEVRDGIVSFVW